MITQDAELSARPPAIPSWDEMDEALKPVLERQMEIYAGFLEHTDYHVNRIFDTLETIGALDNTLIYYIIGDNGASAEGTINGAYNEMATFNGMSAVESPEFMASVKDKLGTVDAYNHYSVGYVHAVPVDQAGRLALGRYAKRHDRALARRDHQQGRRPVAVLSRDRRGTNDSRGRRAAASGLRERRAAGAHRGHQHGLLVRGTGST